MERYRSKLECGPHEDRWRPCWARNTIPGRKEKGTKAVRCWRALWLEVLEAKFCPCSFVINRKQWVSESTLVYNPWYKLTKSWKCMNLKLFIHLKCHCVLWKLLASSRPTPSDFVSLSCSVYQFQHYKLDTVSSDSSICLKINLLCFFYFRVFQVTLTLLYCWWWCV